jgi:hypothetical protein
MERPAEAELCNELKSLFVDTRMSLAAGVPAMHFGREPA